MSLILTFKAIVQIRGINPYILVTAINANELLSNWRKPMPVIVQINGKPDLPWHTNMMPTGDGDFYLYLHGDVRRASSTKVGDKVAAKVWLDVAYQNGPLHPMPKKLQQLFKQNEIAAKRWQELSPSRQKEVLRYIAGLKSEAAIDRNIHMFGGVLLGSNGRFMGRDWEYDAR